jgi:HupE / UreJ protein
VIARIARLAVVTVGAAASLAAAHDRGTSYSTWTIEGRSATVVARFTELDLSRFDWAAGGAPDATVADHVVAAVRLFAGDTACRPAESAKRLSADEGTVAIEWTLRCPGEGALEIRDDLFYDVAPTHLHFARVTRDGSSAMERVLSERDRRWTLAEALPQSATSLGGYVLLGIEHILSGYDHLAFLLALLLVAASAREMASIVTGFTAAHSLTLAMAVLGTVRPEPAAIEALIGLSIALVAAENLWLADRSGRAVPSVIAVVLALLALFAAAGIGRVPALTLGGLALFCGCYFALIATASAPQRLRWGVAFLFGLLHGFGFATVLTTAALPAGRLARALFGFNAGVEIGQLAIVASLWPLLCALRRPLLVELASAGVVALGVFWFVTRAYG